METAIAQPEGTPLEQQQQETVYDTQQTIHDSKTHTLDDTEDYGPLKKKHKYRDDHQRSGSISYSAAHPSVPVGNDADSAAKVLDSSAQMEDTPFVQPPAAVADAQDGPVAAAAGRDQDHHLASTDAAHAEEQQQTVDSHQQLDDERSKSRDLAGSPGSTNEKARKHNFYVPSREVAFLLNNISSTPTSVDFPSQHDTATTTSDGTTSTTVTGGDNNATMNISEAQANANALLAIGTSITGRQAAKIAAMEAKEKIRIAKELELEDAKARKKAELEKKRIDNARKRNVSSTTNQQADGTSPPVSASSTTLNTRSKPAANKSKRAAAPRRSTAKTKLESPELPIPNSTTVHALNVAFPPSPDIKIHSTPTSDLAFNSNNNNNTASANASGVMELPPMPEPATEGMMGFIPYASEGARAAALAKAAKQQKMNGSNAGSPPNSIPVPLPSVRNGKSTSASGNVGGNSSRAGGSSSSSTKRGNNNNSKINKALQNVVSQQSNSSNSTFSNTGRASPTNALEHAAAAIDAVLDAGAAVRAQANLEEEEVDDRLYCICQQLYDPERLMIACDRCDNWYHVDCVNIDETSITLIDLFICPICEKDAGLHTVSKSRCAREECNEPALKLSKYCSDLCGIKVAALNLEQSSSSSSGNHQGNDIDSPENLILLWDAVSEVKKLETVVRSADSAKLGDIHAGQDTMQSATISGEITEASTATYNDIPRGLDLDSRIVEEEYRLQQLQNQLSEYVTKRQNLELSLSLINARLSYLQLAIRRWEATVQAHMANNTKSSGGGSSKSKNKSKSGSSAINADAPCGFDVRLVWDDKDWQEWLDSDEGRNTMMLAEEGDDAATLLPSLNIPREEGAEEEEEEGLICTLSRRKCDRHSAWQKLRDADFQVEKAADEKQLEQLTESERRIRRRVEDIQDFLRRAKEKLEAESSSKRVLEEQGKNDENLAVKEEGGEDAEDIEMSDSMPLTPALVVQKA